MNSRLGVVDTLRALQAENAALQAALALKAATTDVNAALTLRDTAITARALANDLVAALAARPAFALLYKLLDQPRGLIALGDCDDLAFDALAGGSYGFLLTAVFQTAATSVGPKFSLAGPAGGVLTSWRSEIEITGGPSTSAVNVKSQTTPDVEHVTASVDLANTPRVARLQGSWLNGPTAGPVRLRFASEVAGTNITVKRGSWGIVYPLGA